MYVTVVNRRPTADAGDRIMVDVNEERPARVRLDGRASSDPDGHALKHLWNAAGVAFSDPASERPVGTFPVGGTTVKLTVTDEGGARDSANVQVVVRLTNSQERPRGAAANRAFEAGLESATTGASTGRASATRLKALAHSQAAALLGVQAGDRIVWEEDCSSDDAGVEYATLRAVQAQHGAAAARAWLRAYAEEGDQASLTAAMDALRGLGNAQADLIEP